MNKWRQKPWPFEVRDILDEMKREGLMINHMLQTCIAEEEIHNPFLFEPLLPKVAKRIRRTHKLAQKLLDYAPEGQGAPPKWLIYTRKFIRLLGIIAEELDSVETQRKIHENRFPELVADAKSIIQVTGYIEDKIDSIPVEPQPYYYLVKSSTQIKNGPQGPF